MRRRSSFGLLVLAVLSLLVWFYIERPKDVAEYSLTAFDTKEDKSKQSSEELSQHNSQTQQKDTVRSNETQYAEQTWFHQDPFLDYVLVRRYLYPCRKDSYKSDLRGKPMTQQITKAIDQIKQACELWSKRYPEFSDESFSIDAIEASSELGQILKNSPKRDPSDPKVRLESVKESMSMLEWGVEQGDLTAIEWSAQGLKYTWNISFTRPEQALLGGEPLYLDRLSSIAIQLLKCQRSAGFGCHADELTMLVKCLKDETVCGLTYPQWADQILTPGMKMDVEALMDYYSQNMD